MHPILARATASELLLHHPVNVRPHTDSLAFDTKARPDATVPPQHTPLARPTASQLKSHKACPRALTANPGSWLSEERSSTWAAILPIRENDESLAETQSACCVAAISWILVSGGVRSGGNEAHAIFELGIPRPQDLSAGFMTFSYLLCARCAWLYSCNLMSNIGVPRETGRTLRHRNRILTALILEESRSHLIGASHDLSVIVLTYDSGPRSASQQPARLVIYDSRWIRRH